VAAVRDAKTEHARSIKRKQQESELVVDVDCVHECVLMLGSVVHRDMAVHQFSAGAAARRGEFGSSPCCSCGKRLEDAELAGVACMRSGGRRDWANELKTCSCGGAVAHDAEEARSLGNAIVRAVLAVCVVCVLFRLYMAMEPPCIS
jgi:hypothetical protein